EPDAAEILPVQFDYIQQYVDSFETAMASLQFFNLTTGWRKYADDESFMDYFFINELSKNVDGYRLSTFFHKDKDSKGGKIKMGPPWDYNLAWHNADYCNNETTTGWAYRITDNCSADLSFWWKRLMLDSQYKNKMKCRWLTLRTTVLDTTNIFGMMDSMVNYIGVAANRHFNTWQILGSYVWPNPSPLANTYAEEIQQTKNWIAARLTWMDNNLPGICNPAGITEVPKIEVITYPNPVTDALHFNYATAHTRSLQIKIYNAYGACVLIKPLQSIAYQDIAYNIPVNHLHAGMYVLQLIENDFVVSNSKFVKQ
ncbi:MAG TPA: CotH kinase family protein, partial [Bacteroidia bacterium]|nr:CotH kinase family protein [Bacteroidia bacterium]